MEHSPSQTPQTSREITGKPTQLSLRLAAIAAMIPPSDRVIDVGTDHGQIPAFLLENQRVPRVIATDIHEGPAETARKYLRRQGVIRNAEVIRTDGLHGVALQEGDTIVISGLGGLEMIRILQEAFADKDAVPTGIHLVLQPQRSAEELRQYLCGAGFAIDDETVVIDRDKFYVILLATHTATPYPELGIEEAVLGPILLRRSSVEIEEYLRHERNVMKKHMRARPELMEVIRRIDGMIDPTSHPKQ
jgi:tRNA (adenine22-N1)-methyltransferase